MGHLFSKIPVDIIKHCILPWIPDYLDRLHFAMTCKTFWTDMKRIDPLTNAIVECDYCLALTYSAQNNHYISFDRILLNMSYSKCFDDDCNMDECDPVLHLSTRNYRSFACKTLSTKIMKRCRTECRSNIWWFDYHVLIYLHDYFKGDIPKQYMYFLKDHLGLCILYMKLHNLELFKFHHAFCVSVGSLIEIWDFALYHGNYETYKYLWSSILNDDVLKQKFVFRFRNGINSSICQLIEEDDELKKYCEKYEIPIEGLQIKKQKINE
jgi:hypothetical protein